MSERGRGSAQAPGVRRAAGAGAEGRGRFSTRRKAEAVLKLLRGEGLEVLSRELGVRGTPSGEPLGDPMTAATLSGWP